MVHASSSNMGTRGRGYGKGPLASWNELNDVDWRLVYGSRVVSCSDIFFTVILEHRTTHY